MAIIMEKKQILLIICIQLIFSVVPLHQAAKLEDEPLKDMFKSLLPKDFLEKHVGAKVGSSKGSKNSMENMLQGLDNVFQSLNAPDNGNCIYKCPNGGKLAAKPGYKVVPDGCGSHGFKPDVSSLPGLTVCCNKHDICYGTCGKGQSECDTSFNACMSNSCQQMRKSGAVKSEKALQECLSIGSTFHLTVVSVGCQFYREAQTKACVCGSSGKASSSAQDKIRQHNQEKRAREASMAETIADQLDNVDLSDSFFDLPEAVDHSEL